MYLKELVNNLINSASFTDVLIIRGDIILNKLEEFLIAFFENPETICGNF